MMRRLSICLTLAAIVVAGCSFDLRRVRPGDGGTDATAPGDGRASDGRGGDGPSLHDLGPPPEHSILQAVVNRLILPENGNQFAVDLDGDGIEDNRLGGILGLVKGLSVDFDLQQALDSSVTDGDTLILFDLLADDLADSRARVVMMLGEDLDTNPADNFSGSETFGVAQNSPPDIFLDGRITAGRLQGAGRVLFPLRYDTFSEDITLEKAHIEVTVNAQGMTDGVVAGAIPQDQVRTKLLPLIASRLDELYKEAEPGLKEDLRRNFDPNGDGTITLEEFAESIAVSLALEPDVDTDGDHEDDGLSMAAGFTAVKCTIQPGPE